MFADRPCSLFAFRLPRWHLRCEIAPLLIPVSTKYLQKVFAPKHNTVKRWHLCMRLVSSLSGTCIAVASHYSWWLQAKIRATAQRASRAASACRTTGSVSSSSSSYVRCASFWQQYFGYYVRSLRCRLCGHFAVVKRSEWTHFGCVVLFVSRTIIRLWMM